MLVDAATKNRRVGHEDVVPHKLHAPAQLARQHRPAGPVALGQAVLDRHDRILPQPFFPETHHLLGAAVRLPRLFEGVSALAGPELARGWVERHPHVAAGRKTGRGNRLEHDVDRLLVRLEIGREPPLVADAGGVTAPLEDAPQRLEDLVTGPQRLGEARRAERHDHELLKVDARIGVGAAVQDVHHRNRQCEGGAGLGTRAGRDPFPVQRPDVPIQRKPFRRGLCAEGRHRDAEDRVGAQLALGRRAVERHQCLVDAALIQLAVDQSFRDGAVHVADGLAHALAAVAASVAVAQLQGLALAGRRARRHRGTAERAARERHVDFNSRIAARVEDLAGMNSRYLQSRLLGNLKL